MHDTYVQTPGGLPKPRIIDHVEMGIIQGHI